MAQVVTAWFVCTLDEGMFVEVRAIGGVVVLHGHMTDSASKVRTHPEFQNGYFYRLTL